MLQILARFRQIRVLYIGYSTRGTRVSSKALMTLIVSKTSAGYSIVARDQEIVTHTKNPNQNTNTGFYYLIFEVSLLVKAISYI